MCNWMATKNLIHPSERYFLNCWTYLPRLIPPITIALPHLSDVRAGWRSGKSVHIVQVKIQVQHCNHCHHGQQNPCNSSLADCGQKLNGQQSQVVQLTMSMSTSMGMSTSMSTGMTMSMSTGMTMSMSTGMSMSISMGMSMSMSTGMSMSMTMTWLWLWWWIAIPYVS